MRSILMVLLTATLSSTVQFTPLGEQGTLNPPSLKGTPQSQSPAISLARHGQDLTAVFTGVRDDQVGIYSRHFSGEKQTWSPTVPISPEAGNSAFSPYLWVDTRGNSHCLWLTRAGRGRYEVFYSRREKDGEHGWSQPHLLSEGGQAIAPQLMEDGFGNLLAYYWNRDANERWGRVFVFSSRDGGKTWKNSDPNFQAHEKYGKASGVQAAQLPSGGAGLVWLDASPGGGSLVFNRTESGGESWLERPVVVRGNSGQALSSPQILVAGQTIHVTWTIRFRTPRGPHLEVWTANSEDQGLSWSEARKIHEAAGLDIEMELFQDRAGQVGWIGTERLPTSTQPPGPPGDRLLEVVFWKSGQSLAHPVVKEIHRSIDHVFTEIRVLPSSQQVLVLVSEISSLEASRTLSFVREKGAFQQGPSIEAKSEGAEIRGAIADYDDKAQILTVLFHESKREVAGLVPIPSLSTIGWQRYRWH